MLEIVEYDSLLLLEIIKVGLYHGYEGFQLTGCNCWCKEEQNHKMILFFVQDKSFEVNCQSLQKASPQEAYRRYTEVK